MVGRGGERVTRRRRRRWGVAAPWRWILSGSTGWIAGHVDTEGLYFEISLLSLPQICCFFAYILSLKSRQHSCRGKWVLFRVEKGHPPTPHTPPPCSFSFFAFVGGGEAAEAGPAFVVRRRRISALPRAHAAHVRGEDRRRWLISCSPIWAEVDPC